MVSDSRTEDGGDLVAMKRTKARVIIVALVAMIIGILLLWTSMALLTPWNAVVGTLATVIVTIGAVNLISDLFLQSAVSRDLISLIQSDRRLIDAGLDGLTKVEDADWMDLFASGQDVECAAIDPHQFKSHIWPRLIDAAKTRLHAIELIVVDVSDEERLGEVAERLGTTVPDYVKAVRQLESDVEREWKAMKGSSTTKCSLTIRRSSSIPRYGYVEAGRASALILEPISRSTGLGESFVLRFRTERGGNRYATWLTDATHALRVTYSAPSYSDVSRATEPEAGL